MNRILRLFKALLLVLISIFTLTVTTNPSSAQSPEKLKAEDEIYREYMQTITRQLGVTCNTCHNVKNWKSDEKPHFKTAKEHIRLVQMLIDNGMNGEKGAPKADCYMCHRGVLKPAYREPHDPLLMKKIINKKTEVKKDVDEEE
jgi:hypothetical protein